MRELVIVCLVLASIAVPASGQERLVVTDRAAVILNPVKPDSTAEFEIGLAQLRAALEAASDPIKKQQAQGWKMYRASEPIGPNALYVFILDPAVPFADYSFKRLLDSLPASEAEAALKRLAGSLADAQRVFSMKLQAVPPERKLEPMKKKKEKPRGGA
jgi:hypothetical protein